MLLLANSELYNNCLHTALAKQIKFTEEAFAEGANSDMGEYAIAGSDAIIQIIGPTTYKYDFWSWLMGGTSYQGLMKKLQDANADESVERIILLMDTPGGQVTGLKEVAAAIKNSAKEVITFIDPCCASAGLYMASQCSRIVGVPSAEIGSLGTQTVRYSEFRALEEQGIDVKVIKAEIGPYKNLGHPLEPLSEEAIAEAQQRVDKMGEEFLATVAEGRGVTYDFARENFGGGRMLFADDAIAVGLMDEVMSLSELVSENRGYKPKLKRRL